MRTWAFCIAADPAEQAPPSGYVRAATEREALDLLGHRDANLYPLPAGRIGRASLAPRSI